MRWLKVSWKQKGVIGMAVALLIMPLYTDFVQAQESAALVDESPLTEEDLKKIQDVYNQITQYYIEDIDKSVLLQGALEGMVNALEDPYSEYLDAAESERFDETFEGSFVGIGIQFMMQNGQVIVISPIADTPADKAGLQPNDILLEADGVSLSDLNTNEVVELIRGEKGTEVTILIQRGDSTFEVTMTRDDIPLITVSGEVDEDDATIGYVSINQFAGSTYDELVETIETLRQEGVTSFVFDLRNNPGGLLDQALDISNMFLESGQTIVQMQEQTADPKVYKADPLYGTFKIDEPYVVLINEGSASASEILAAAISENTDFPLVGATTFGKGTAQNILSESELGELKLTTAKWLTPSGLWIHETGVTPDVEVQASPVATSVLLSSDEVLELGATNDYVKSVIVILQALGYEVDSEYLYNESVKQAVELFQADHDLEVTGIVTGDTANKLNDEARSYLETHDPQYDKAVEILKGL